MKRMRLIALVLAFAVLLCGCKMTDDSPESTTSVRTVLVTRTQPPETKPTQTQPTEDPPPEDPPTSDEKWVSPDPWEAPVFEEMEYTRPDVDALSAALDSCMELADGEDPEALANAVETYMLQCSSFVSSYRLAYIHYNLDLSDDQWEREHDYCSDNLAQVEADMDQLMHTLADSDHRAYLEGQDYFGEGFFSGYEGESLWTDRFTELMEYENLLQADYYDLLSEGGDPDALAQLLVEMIRLRQQIAAEAGFENYAAFAYDHHYDRDYTVAQAAAYLEDIQEELVPLYLELFRDDSWADGLTITSYRKIFAYVENLAKAMGGEVEEAFRLMDEKELYHIRMGRNKLDTSFEIFLPDYMTPFVFLNPTTATSYDHLTFAHEFGHFCSDYASNGSLASIDVEEIFSQGLENLSLCYVGSELTSVRMGMSLATYVEQGAYADFEHRIYALEPEEVTVESVRQVFAQVNEDYDLGYPEDAFVQINHFFTSPLYVMSYVTSNDAALQLYQMELAEPGSGVACYMENLDSDAVTFLAFLEEAGLESPFAPGRIEDVRETLENAF